MKIKQLDLRAWQVIRQADFEDLSDFVVIAGPNGVGKTKVKEALVYVFQNSGNPPPGGRVILQATSEGEKSAWGAPEITLPSSQLWSFIGRNTKRLKTESRLIQIDSNRAVESINFQQLNFTSIGDPEGEEVGYGWGFNPVRGRFQEICNTLHRLKSREVASIYSAYESSSRASPSGAVSVTRLDDPIQKYVKLFGELLYPKQMEPIGLTSTTIQFKDEDGQIRQFSDLSSGEREVVILAFDILTQNPDDCVVLIDEPEVHLHPELTFRLITALKSIGQRNQFFLFTHSPDIIGHALDTGVHFIRPKSRVPTGNQVVRVDDSNLAGLKAIPNIRDTVGMITVGKRLLFVEGNAGSIDRNVFATLAKASHVGLAIVPSESCTNINNMALMSETLERGVFGLSLRMIRDRDGLTEQQIETFTAKSVGRLMFLPYYHIENAFLSGAAIATVAKKILLGDAPSQHEIETKLLELARAQLHFAATTYVKSEIYFEAGNFDVSPVVNVNEADVAQIATAMNASATRLIEQYKSNFSTSEIEKRLVSWRFRLEQSILSGWSEEAQQLFIGKRMLAELQIWLFKNKQIRLWEHVINSQDESCIRACHKLREMLTAVDKDS